METFSREQPARFSSPEEEIAFLRKELSERERSVATETTPAQVNRDHLASEAIKQYQEVVEAGATDHAHALSPEAVDFIALGLKPEAHDDKIAELIVVMERKGVGNALSVVRKLNNPHLEDDFHRFLVQYLKHDEKALKVSRPLKLALSYGLFEILLPKHSRDTDNTASPQAMIAQMEQVLSALRSLSAKARVRHLVFEVAQPDESNETRFFVALPREYGELLEKQIYAAYPGASVVEAVNDYNIFTEGGETVGAVARLSEPALWPLKAGEQFKTSPSKVILNAFAKLQYAGEGAAIQIVLTPESERSAKPYREARELLRQGKTRKEVSEKLGRPLFVEILSDILGGAKKPEAEEEKKEPLVIDEEAIQLIDDKLSEPLWSMNLRLVVSAPERERSRQILSALQASFNQFERPHANKLEWANLERGSLRSMLRNFTFRSFERSRALLLNQAEVASLFHYPAAIDQVADNIKTARAEAALPMSLGEEGVILGTASYRGQAKPVYLAPDDRLRHLYVIGQTGTGKSTLLKNLVIQDMHAGEGVCMIDPHGQDIEEVLAAVPADRLDDLIYFDPADTEYPLGLNMLEFDPRYPEQKTFVVNELLSIFNKLFDMKQAGGPMFELYFRNSVLLVMEEPGTTLLDVSRVLADQKYRDSLLAKCTNPVVTQFWREVASKAGGEASLQNMVPYITSKFDGFITNEIMRPIIAQGKSAFNFRQVMDERKILLVNLSKGRLGDLNAYLIGLILVGKLLMAALSRVDVEESKRHPFYLYLDEFQNVTTDSIATILSEARKYKLSLTMAHQFIKQLDEKIRDAVFGNVGSQAAFRVGEEDAEFLEKRFAPRFSAADIANIENRHAFVKMLVHGVPEDPFKIATIAPAPSLHSDSAALKAKSAERYGRPRAEVEAEIKARYLSL